MVGIADQGVGLIVKITDGDALWRVANTVLIETLVQLELITPKEFELIKKEKIHYKPDLSKQVGGRFQSVQPVFKIHKLHGWD
jgi:L-asparaginase II